MIAKEPVHKIIILLDGRRTVQATFKAFFNRSIFFLGFTAIYSIYKWLGTFSQH